MAAELQSPSIAIQVRQTAPIALALLLFGLVTLLFVQRPVTNRLTLAAETHRTGLGGWLFNIVHNLSYIVIPTIGATAILLIIPLFDIRPNSARNLQELAPVMAACLIGAHWLGNTLFSPKVPSARLFTVTDDEARSGVRLCQGLGLFLAFELVLEILERDQSFSPGAMSALSAPTIFFGGFLLWKLSGLLRMEKDRPAQSSPEYSVQVPDGAHANESGFLTFLSVLIKASTIIAALLVVAGYVRLSREAIIPMVLTIALLGLAVFLFHLAIHIYRSAFRLTAEEGHPILLSIGLVSVLALVLAPMIAIVWGARPSDIAEVWRLLTEGVQLGDIQLSLDVVITLIIVFALGALLTRWVQRTLQVSVLPRTRMDVGAQTALVTGIGYLGLTLAALIAVSTAGLNLSSLAVVAGALSVGIGFGLQAVVSNFVSGIILLIERPIKEGDWIEVSGHSGFVRKISVRSTRIETFDRHDVIIPNSDLISGSVKNMTLTSKTGRLIVPVGVAYGSDLEKTRSIMMVAAETHDAVLRYPEPMVLFVGLGDNSLDFELRCYLGDIGSLLTTKSDLLFSIYTELGRAGIEIPFPQRDLHLKDIDRLVAALESRRAPQGLASPTPEQ